MTLIRNTGSIYRAIKTTRRLTPKEFEEATRKAIADAIRSGTEHKLYWFIKMKVAPRHWQGLDDDGDDRIACWPESRFPVIPLIQDLNGNYAEILAESFRYSNKDAQFYPGLTSVNELERTTPGRWYVWGELEIDVICRRCGQVHHINANAGTARCDCLTYRVDPNPLGLMRVSRAFIDGIMWERLV